MRGVTTMEDPTRNTERWSPVAGWEDCYEVSDQGRVRSVTHVVMRSNGIPQTISARILKTPLGNHGYPRVNLCRDGRYVQRCIHALVLESFVGPCPPGLECLHGNGHRHDARLANLRWGTSKENKADAVRHGTAWWLK